MTLLIEKIPPARDSDVEFSVGKKVIKWKSFNDRYKAILTPVNDEMGVELKNVFPPPVKRYGLVFDKKKENMYYAKDCPTTYLTTKSANVLLTMTFLVGVYDDHTNDTEEFIVSDYHWSIFDKSSDAFRGVSVISVGNENFDLFLNGARDVDGGKNCLKIGENLEKDYFYTLQVFWGWHMGLDMNSFHVLYRDGQPLMDRKTFQYNSLPLVVTPALYLGGFNASTKDEEKVIKSKCFTGILSNLEILWTDQSSIPDDLLSFIVDTQTIMNEEHVSPPASKRKKII